VASKRKGLGKQNFERVKGWVNEKQNNSRVIKLYCHFQSMTHSNIEDLKAMSTVICIYKFAQAVIKLTCH
jgi:hypothetical protein